MRLNNIQKCPSSTKVDHCTMKCIGIHNMTITFYFTKKHIICSILKHIVNKQEILWIQNSCFRNWYWVLGSKKSTFEIICLIYYVKIVFWERLTKKEISNLTTSNRNKSDILSETLQPMVTLSEMQPVKQDLQTSKYLKLGALPNKMG